MNRRRAGAGAAGPVVAVAVLVSVSIVLLLAVASSGVVRVWSDPPPDRVRELAPREEDPGTTLPTERPLPPAPADTPTEPWWSDVLAVVLVVLLGRLGWIAVVFWWRVLRSRDGRRRKRS